MRGQKSSTRQKRKNNDGWRDCCLSWAISPRPFPSSQICLLLDSSFVLYFICLLFMVNFPTSLRPILLPWSLILWLILITLEYLLDIDWPHTFMIMIHLLSGRWCQWLFLYDSVSLMSCFHKFSHSSFTPSYVYSTVYFLK